MRPGGGGGGGSNSSGFSENRSWLCNDTKVKKGVNCPAVGTEPHKRAHSATGFQRDRVSYAGSKSSEGRGGHFYMSLS